LAVKPNNPQAQASAQTPATETVAEPIAAPLAASANEVLTDEQIAAKMRSDADRLFKEAKALREQAEELSPTKRKTTRKQTESAT